ncbi:MAG: hypothetical protein H6677_25965 [Candidatus Obscuribacterales bacterium]|nr:hypothetical protein [Candidatus Obscuribacterales bacterium]
MTVIITAESLSTESSTEGSTVHGDWNSGIKKGAVVVVEFQSTTDEAIKLATSAKKPRR